MIIIYIYDMHLNQCNTSSDVIIFFHYSCSLWINNVIEDRRTNYIIIIIINVYHISLKN